MSAGRADMFSALAVRPEHTIFLGDSLIQNGEWSELLNNPNVLNRGITGQWSSVLKSRLGSIFATGQPGRIFLMTGINDLKARAPEESASTVSSILKELQRLTPQSDVIVQSVLPINNRLHDTGRSNIQIERLNVLLRQLCESHHCTYLDLNSHFKNEHGRLNPAFSYDGVHLNGKGYIHWRQQLLPLLDMPQSASKAAKAQRL